MQTTLPTAGLLPLFEIWFRSACKSVATAPRKTCSFMHWKHLIIHLCKSDFSVRIPHAWVRAAASRVRSLTLSHFTPEATPLASIRRSQHTSYSTWSSSLWLKCLRARATFRSAVNCIRFAATVCRFLRCVCVCPNETPSIGANFPPDQQAALCWASFCFVRPRMHKSV